MLQLSAGIWIELAVWLALARVAQPALELLPIQRPLFYESVRESGAQILERMGAELLAIRYALAERWPEVALSAVLPVHWAIWAAYGDDIGDPSTLYSTIRTNRAYAGIRTPMREVDGGVVPDYGGRFFTEDIPFGLVVVRGMADLLGVATPMIDEVIAWSQAQMELEYLVDGALTGRDIADSGAPQCHGITDVETLLASSVGQPYRRPPDGRRTVV